MRDKIKKPLLVLSITLLSVSCAAAIFGISYAGFERKKTIEDPTMDSNLTIAGQGKRLTSYYLDLGIWNGLDASTYNFYALAFKNSDHTQFTWVLGILDGANYRYTFDVVGKDRIQFCAMPKSYGAPSTFDHRNRTDSSGYSTDLTYELSFESNKVTYQITGWHGDSFEAVGYWR